MPLTEAQVVVLGAGPAGCAAAVQLSRLGLRPLLLDRRGKAGGLIENAYLVENYPGPEAPLTGPQFAVRLRVHLRRFGVEVSRGEVHRVARQGEALLLYGDVDRVCTRALVLATGTAPRPLGLDNEAELSGRWLHWEVRTLLPKRPARVAVVGGGEAAFDYALSLARGGARVTILMRAARPRARGRLLHWVEQHRAVELWPGTRLLAAVEREGELALSLHQQGQRRWQRVDALVAAVGREAAKRPRLDEGVAHSPGVYLVGDAHHGRLGQAGMAVGSGLWAAAEVASFLERGSQSHKSGSEDA